MYILSNVKKINSSNKKELQISAKLTAIGQTKKDILWSKIEENFSDIINDKWNTKNLDYYLFF